MFLVAVYMFVSNPQACGAWPLPARARRAPPAVPRQSAPAPEMRAPPRRDTLLPGTGTPGLAGVGSPVLAPSRERLLDLDLGADLFELLLDRGRLLLGDTLLHDLGGSVHEVLGLLEAEAGDLAHDLDHVDLLVARAHEVNRELGLLLGRRGRPGGRRSR